MLKLMLTPSLLQNHLDSETLVHYYFITVGKLVFDE